MAIVGVYFVLLIAAFIVSVVIIAPAVLGLVFGIRRIKQKNSRDVAGIVLASLALLIAMGNIFAWLVTSGYGLMPTLMCF